MIYQPWAAETSSGQVWDTATRVWATEEVRSRCSRRSLVNTHDPEESQWVSMCGNVERAAEIYTCTLNTHDSLITVHYLHDVASDREGH